MAISRRWTCDESWFVRAWWNDHAPWSAVGAPARPAAGPIALAQVEGPFGRCGNAGEAVWRNRPWAVERVNARRRSLLERRVAGVERGGSNDALDVARTRSARPHDDVALGGFQGGAMRVGDHELQPPQGVRVMDRAGRPGVRLDVEASGCGLPAPRRFAAEQRVQPHACRMAWKATTP